MRGLVGQRGVAYPRGFLRCGWRRQREATHHGHALPLGAHAPHPPLVRLLGGQLHQQKSRRTQALFGGDAVGQGPVTEQIAQHGWLGLLRRLPAQLHRPQLATGLLSAKYFIDLSK